MSRKRTPRARAESEQVIEPSTPQPLFKFHGLGAEVFEECCCHIFFYEPEVKNPDLYKRPRQSQYGADALADRRDGSGIDAVSAKHYQTVRKGQIETFVNEFLDHWDSHWATQRVRRFVLCVACDLKSGERRAEIAAQRKRFAALDVEFEVWSQRPLSHRLHPHPELIRTYFPDYYDRNYAAPSVKPNFADASLAQAGVLISNATAAQIVGLQSEIAQDVAGQLDGFQTLLKQGRRSEVEAGLLSLRKNELRWSSLDPAVQARVMRMQALVALKVGDQDQCAQLLNEADKISPADEPRIRALLVLQTEGWDAALRTLEQPTTKDGALLRAGLLIEARRVPEAKDLLHQCNSLKGTEAEWHRLCAYVACIEGRPADGLSEILAAEKLAPDWLAVLETGAIVRYAASLSPAVKFHGGAMPEPLSQAFAKQDDASQQRFQEAYQRFDKLVQSEGELQWRQRLEIWRFACLAQLSGRENEAEAACVALLKQDPIAPVAVFWALERRYGFDLKETTQRLEARLRDSESSIDDLQAAVACAITNRDSKKAAAILKRHAARFSNNPMTKRIADHLSARVAANRSQQLSLQVASDPYDQLDTLIRAARLSRDWAPVDAFLAAKTDQPELLWLGCSALSSNRQWPIVLKYSLGLLESLGTAEALRLAAIATYNVGQYEQAIDLLHTRAHLFPGSQLPLDLQRLNAYAAAKRGDLFAALPIVTNLASKSGNHKDKVLLVDLLIQAGDVNRAVSHLRDFLPSGKWTARELLHWVPTISNEEPELARTLVRMAAALDTKHTYGTTLVSWSYRLGLDDEANKLLGAMQSGPRSADLHQASLEEVVEYMRQQQATNEEMGRRYRHGEAPIHILAGPARVNLAELWDAVFHDRNGGLPLFIRSGNRSEEFFLQRAQGIVDLHLDVTAILTVDQLDLLDLFDGKDLAITLPHTLLQLLQVLEQDARPIQPSRIPILEAALEGVTTGKLRVWQEATVPEPHSVRVTFEVPKSEDEENNSPAAPTATLGAVADELVRRRGASTQEVAEIRSKSVSWQNIESTIDLSEVDTLIFDGNTIDVAIESDLLDRLRAHFAVWIEADHHARCLAQLNHLRNGTAVAERLRALRHRLSERIQAGAYRVLPQPTERHHPGERADARARLLPLLELLNLPTSENAWLWIDDRHCTAYTWSNGNNIVSTYEVLDHLRHLGKLDDARYYTLLGRMRAVNVQLLPLHQDEVLFALRQPSVGVEDERLVETPSLAVLRRAFNRMLDLEAELDLAPPQRELGKPLAELACLLRSFGLARRCLEEIWSDPHFPDSLRVPASDWTWESFRIERFLRLPIDGDADQRRRIGRMAALMEVLVAVSISWRSEGSEESLRTRYLEWLQTKNVDITGDGDLNALNEIALQLARSIVDLAKSDGTEHYAGISPALIRAHLGLFVNEIPDAVRERLYADPLFVSAMKPDVHKVVNIGDASFVASTFWSAAAAARVGNDRTVTSVQGADYTLRHRKGAFELTKGSQGVRFGDDELGLLSEDIEERRSYLRQCRWLGDSDAEHLAEVERIASMAQPTERIETVHRWREANPSARYEALRNTLTSKTSVPLDALSAGSAKSYMQYLGLVIEDGTVNWDASARSFIERFDAFELLERWSGLPIRLPDTVVHAYSAAPPESRAQYLKSDDESALPPLRYMRALELARSTASPADEAPWLHAGLARWSELSPVFLTVLQWSERLWERDRGWHEIPVAARLALVWAHADRILRIFLAVGSKVETIAERFAHFHTSSIRYALPLDRQYDSDVASPSRITSPTLLALSLNAASGAARPLAWDEEKANLVSVVARTTDEGDMWPLPHLFEDRRGGRNALRSYLADEAHPWLAESFGREEAQPLSPQGQETFLAALLTNLEADPSEPNLWGMTAMVGVQWFSEESLVRLEAAAKTLQFPEGRADAKTRVVWSGVSGALPYLSGECRAHIRRGLIEWARRLRQIHPAPQVSPYGSSPASKDSEVVIDVALSLSRRDRLKESFDELGSIVAELIWAWPAIVPSLRDLFNRALRESPSVDVEGLWQTYVKMRTVP